MTALKPGDFVVLNDDGRTFLQGVFAGHSLYDLATHPVWEVASGYRPDGSTNGLDLVPCSPVGRMDDPRVALRIRDRGEGRGLLSFLRNELELATSADLTAQIVGPPPPSFEYAGLIEDEEEAEEEQQDEDDDDYDDDDNF